VIEHMKSCDECSKLENRLRRANDYYVRLIFQQERMVRDGNAGAEAFEDAMQEAQSRRTSAAQDLLTHSGTHEELSRPKTRTANQH